MLTILFQIIALSFQCFRFIPYGYIKRRPLARVLFPTLEHANSKDEEEE